MALVTRDDVKTFLQVTHSDDDSLIDLLISYVSDFAEKVAGVHFASTAITRAFDGGCRSILLKPPVVSITSVTDDGGAGDAVDSADYDFDPVTGELFLKSGADWPAGRREFEVVYNSGHTAAPAAVALGAQGLIAKYYNKRDPDLLAESLGDWKVSNDTTLKAFVRAVKAYGRLPI